MNRLTTHTDIEDARRRIASLLEARAEWFCTERRGGCRGVGLRRGEWELSASPRGLLFSFWGAAGARVWRVVAWESDGEKISLEAARRMGAERATLELVPRATVAAEKALVSDARRAECERLATLTREALPGAKIKSAALSAGARRGEPGRYARIRLAHEGAHVFATGPVVQLGAEEADAFLSSALLWFMRAAERRRDARAHRLVLLTPPKLCAATCERLALLREDLRHAASVYEVGEGAHTFDEERRALTPARVPSLEELLSRPAPRLARVATDERSELAERIVALAPEVIDVVRARRGETLRFRGLPFARVRRVAGREHLWFGAVRAARMCLLDETNWPELSKLLEELAGHRHAAPPDRAHALYRAAPEAWLESLLRRDITRLDPGLRLAPLHAQFRISRAATGDGAANASRPIDLLALRRDGRLAVIELKVNEDAALPLQGADYWRRVHAQHRAGHIRRARLFGDAPISEDPPLLYLVAPLLRFHRSFHTLARCLSPDIELYRFDLNEDWRAGVRVARRTRVV
jgi:hypothetical protein